MTNRFTILSLALFGMLAGCADYRDSNSAYPGFGDAVRQNNAVMIADPNPPTAANTDIDMNGERAGLAYYRYRTGTVIPPVQLRTSNVLSGGSSSSSGN
jgi:hypothetical protein